MARCPFAEWLEMPGVSGPFLDGPFKIVHHTTEGHSAEDAFLAFRKHRSKPHFTVDSLRTYQHVDTSEFARALKSAAGGVETNRDSAIQIEVVGFAHLPKGGATLANVARLCRWIEGEHGIPRTWPNGPPKPAVHGRDPGNHNRDAATWDEQGGHYGHCHVPENDHWDPGYSEDEVQYLMHTEFERGFTGLPRSAPPSLPETSPADFERATSTMIDHADVGENSP